MPAKDGLIIQEETWFKNVNNRQQLSSRCLSENHYGERIPEQINADESILLRKKIMPQRTFISKEEKQEDLRQEGMG